MNKITLLFLFLCGCLHYSPTPKKLNVSPNYSITVEHFGQTKYNLEYEKIFISANASFIKTHNNIHHFQVTEAELNLLAQTLEVQTPSSQNSFSKETLIIMENANSKWEKKDSIWNLAKFIEPIENLIETKINLPFRIPLVVPNDLVIQVQQKQDLYSETGKYIRVFNGESHISVVEESQKQLHTFTVTLADLQEFQDTIKKSFFYWKNDSLQYGNVRTIITWGKNKIEKKLSLATLENIIEKKAAINSFPISDPIPENLQIEIHYEKNDITYKDIYLSKNTCYIYTLNDDQNRTQKNFTLSPQEFTSILETIKKNETSNNQDLPVTLNISWKKSSLEKNISIDFLTSLEKQIKNLINRKKR